MDMDLPQIPIVSRIVPPHQMPKCRLAVPPFVALPKHLRPLDLRNLLAQLVVRLRDVHLLDRLVARRLVHRHVEDAKVQLPQIEQRVVDVLRPDQILNQLVWDLLRRLRRPDRRLLLPGLKVLRRQRRVVLAQRLQLPRRPAPVLQHLAGRFDKVPHSVRAVEPRVRRLRHEVVDPVSQLVEQRHHLVVLQQTGFLRRWLGEVAHQRRGRVSAFAVDIDEALHHVSQIGSAGKNINKGAYRLQVKVGRMPVFALTRE